MATLKLILSSCISIDVGSIDSNSAVSNALTDADSVSSYATFKPSVVNYTQYTVDVTYGFGTSSLSSLPSNITINSIICRACGYVSKHSSETSSSFTGQFQLYSGSTQKNVVDTYTGSYGTKTIDISNWTLSELKNARLRLYGRGKSNFLTATLCGADITIDYTVNSSGGSGGSGGSGSEALDFKYNSYLNIGGVNKFLKGGYANINGIWKPMSDIKMSVGGSTSVTLPSGYTRVEYIQSSGTQYINTGFKPNNASRIVLDIDVTAKSSQSGIFGARNGTASSGFNVWTWNDNAGYQVDYGTQQFLEVGGNSSGRHILDLNQHVFYVDANPVNIATVQSFNCSYNAYLFTVSSGGNLMTNYPCIAKLYSCQIYNNGTLVRDFVPCTNPSGVAGLYDTVNDAFYTNEGSGTFAVGQTIGADGSIWRSVPWSGLTMVEYIQSSGTQYIDTGFKPNQNTRLVADIDTGSSWSTSFPCLFGVGTTSGSGSSDKFMCFLYNDIGGVHDHYGSQTRNSSTVRMYGRHIIDKNKNTTIVDGTTVNTFTYTSFQQALTLPLFCALDGGSYSYYSTMKLYSCQIYDNGTLIRNYRPCVKSDGTVGLYDMVNEMFYKNAGSGVFTAGPTI